MPDINITYDTLVDLSRRERSRSELQKLEPTFYHDVVSYLKEKQAILDDLKGRDEPDQARNTQNQLHNARKLIKDIYDRRERKIFEMSLNKSRTGSDIIDTSALLEEEKRFFELMVKLLNKYREGLLGTTLSLQPIIPHKEEPEAPKPEGDKLVRFLHAVPKFVGADLAVYGPYEAEDMAKLSADVADVLIKKGRVEEISEE